MKRLLVLLSLFICTTCYALEPLSDEVIKQSNTTMLLRYMVKQEQMIENKMDFEQFYQNLSKVVNEANRRNDFEVTADEKLSYKLNPDSKLFGFSPNETSAIWINHSYLNTYEPKLDSVWKSYFKLYKTMPDFYIFGNGVQTAKSLIALQKFQKKNRNFLPEIIQQKIREEFYWLADNSYAFYSGSLSDDFKEGYLYYLTFGNSETKEYQTIQSCYDALKRSYFKPNYNFYLSLYKYENHAYYKSLLGRL